MWGNDLVHTLISHIPSTGTVNKLRLIYLLLGTQLFLHRTDAQNTNNRGYLRAEKPVRPFRWRNFTDYLKTNTLSLITFEETYGPFASTDGSLR